MPWVYKKRRKKNIRKAIKIYAGIVLVCLVAAAAISFFTTEVPTFLRQRINGAVIGEAEKTLGRKLNAGDIDLMEKTFGIKIDAGSLKGGKAGRYRGKVARGPSGWSPGAGGGRNTASELLGRLKEKYGGSIDSTTLQRLKEAYRHGKIDPSGIERARRAYRSGQIDRADVKRGKKAIGGRKPR